MNRWSTTGLVAMLMTLAGCSDGAIVDQESLAQDEQAIADCSVEWEKELMITDLRVVKDARAMNMGPWSWGHAMTVMAGQNDPQVFVKKLVESWMTNQNVGGTLVPARTKMETLVLAPWRNRSAPGKYDLDKAPFELLAIVYRPDLRRQGSFGVDAGEGRLVYGVKGPNGEALLMTMILEFRLPIREGQRAENWAQLWHSLGSYDLGSAGYNAKLEEISNRFAGPTARAGALNGSDLHQARTNELALVLDEGGLWELREFHLESDGFLYPAMTALTPDLSLNGTSTLATFINQNARAIEDGTHNVPVKFRSQPFKAGSTIVPTETFVWNAPGVAASTLEQFSINTCNGCHAGNTGTRFLHVVPRFDPTQPASLSNFVIDDMPRRVDEVKTLLGCQ